MGDLSGIAQEIRAIVEADERLQQLEQERNAAARASVTAMLNRLTDIPDLLKAQGFAVQGWAGGSAFERLLLPDDVLAQNLAFELGISITLQGRREPRGRQSILTGIIAGFRGHDRDQVVLAAGYVMPGVSPPKVPWKDHVPAIIGTAGEEAAILALTSGFRAHLPDALRAFRDDLAGVE
jgi:hypothetical protein